MEAEPLDIRIDDLLVHAGWVRGLARKLVSDPSVADDLVQETWIAALRNPPRDDRNLKGWLARLVKNFARQRARSESRRGGRESVVAERRAEQGPPTPEELVGRVDTQRMLADQVVALAEPYRTTVLLRYYEGWTAVEIARHQGVPAGTVRWRLKQGLDVLRERLDESHGGDRRAWALGLCALLSREPVRSAGTGVAATIQGVLLMNVYLKLALVAGTLLLGFFLYELRDGGRAVEPALVSLPDPAPAAVAPEAAPTETPPDAEDRRSAVEVTEPETAPTAEPEVPPAVAEAPATRLEARVLDEEGEPLTGAAMFLQDSRRQRAETGADGRVSLPLDDGVWHHPTIVFTAPDRTRVTRDVVVSQGRATWLGDVILGPAGIVTGRVVDETGRPLSDAWVRFDDRVGSERAVERQRRQWSDRGAHLPYHLVTDEEGRFELDGIGVGQGRLWAGRVGRMAAYSAPIEIRYRETTVVPDLVSAPLASEDVIAGRVVDPAGQPVPRAQVQFRYSGLFGSGSHGVSADEDGYFRVLLEPRRKRDVRVADREGRFSDAVAEGVRPGTTDLVLRFGEFGSLTLRVRDGAGRPVTALAAGVRGESEQFSSLDEHESISGDYVLRAPSERFVVDVRAEGFAEARLGPFEPLSGPIDCTLQALPGVRGVVVAGGRAVAGARVHLHAVLPQRFMRDGFPVRFMPEPTVEGETDADGRFAMTVRGSGTYALLCEAEGHAPAELDAFDVEPEVGRDGLQVELGAGGVIEGLVLTDADTNAAGKIVGVSCGDGRARTQVVGPDGSFRFDALTPGRWQVQEMDREILDDRGGYSAVSGGPRAAAEIPWVCAVFEGQVTGYDLDLRAGSGTVLVGSLILDGGPPPARDAWTAQLILAELIVHTQEDVTEARLDETGAFRVKPKAPGRYRLLVKSATAGEEALVLMQELELGVGETRWDLEAETASLELTGAEPAISPIPTAVYLWEQGDAVGIVPIRPGDEGRVEIPLVLAGRGRIVRMDVMRFMEDPRKLDTIVELDVEPGKRTTIALPEPK